MEQVIIILQAITIFTSTAFIVINFLTGIKEARNQSILSVISSARKERWQRLMKASTEIGYNVDIISESGALDAKQIKQAYIKLSHAVSSLSFVLNSVYSIDIDIIKNAAEILQLAKGIALNGEKDPSKLNESYAKFYRAVSIYSHVEWTRIKEQAKGKRSELEEWEKQYAAFTKDIPE